MTLDEKAKEACRLIQGGDAYKAMSLVDDLIEAQYETAFFIKGMLLLTGSWKVEVDVPQAIDCFRRQAVITPDATSYLYLAKALMRREGSAREEALQWLQRAAETRNPPETDLGFAAYYERASTPDLERSRKHYLRAAVRGRFAGFTGLARVQRLQGHGMRAVLTMSILWLLSPFIYLAVGSKARSSF